MENKKDLSRQLNVLAILLLILYIPAMHFTHLILSSVFANAAVMQRIIGFAPSIIYIGAVVVILILSLKFNKNQ